MKQRILLSLVVGLLIMVAGCETEQFPKSTQAQIILAEPINNNEQNDKNCPQNQTELPTEEIEAEQEREQKQEQESVAIYDTFLDTTIEKESSSEIVSDNSIVQIIGTWSLCHDGEGDILLLTLNEEGNGSITTYYGEEQFQWNIEESSIIIHRNNLTEECPFSITDNYLQISFRGMDLTFQLKS